YGIARAGAVSWLERLARQPRDDPRRHAIEALGAAKGDADKIATILQQVASRAVEHETGTDWNDFLEAFRALRDRGDEPSRKAIGVLLDIALVNATRGTGVDDQTLGLFVDYIHQARAASCTRGLTTIIRGNRGHPLKFLAMDALATIDPALATKVLTPLLEAPHMGNEAVAVISRSLARAGDLAKAERAIEIQKAAVAQAVSGNGRYTFPGALNTLGIEYAYGGQFAESLLCYRRMRWLDPSSNMASYNIACVHALAGEKEAAIRWLRRSTREGFKDWRHVKGDPDLACVYEDPRFVRLVDALRRVQEVEPGIER